MPDLRAALGFALAATALAISRSAAPAPAELAWPLAWPLDTGALEVDGALTLTLWVPTGPPAARPGA